MPLTSRKHHKNRSPRADGTHMNNRTTVLARVQFFSRNISQGFQSVFVNNRAPTELTNTHSALHVNNSTSALNIEGTKDDGMEEVGEEELDSGRTSWTSSGTESTIDTTSSEENSNSRNHHHTRNNHTSSNNNVWQCRWQWLLW